MVYFYLTIEQAIEIHALTLAKSGGGIQGILNIGYLKSALDHIQNDEFYPTMEKKLTHLFFCACKFHCFQDGNKRIAITLCYQMLVCNGYSHCSPHFIRDAENISYHVAAGNISKELLGRWMEAIVYDNADDESLKLDILLAMSQGKP